MFEHSGIDSQTAILILITIRLIEQLGATVVGINFLAELPALGGRSRLPEGIVSAIIPF
ncbi:MAG: hypothetical protein ACKO8J_05660 [Candidatus Limnocylindrus sp.]